MNRISWYVYLNLIECLSLLLLKKIVWLILCEQWTGCSTFMHLLICHLLHSVCRDFLRDRCIANIPLDWPMYRVYVWMHAFLYSNPTTIFANLCWFSADYHLESWKVWNYTTKKNSVKKKRRKKNMKKLTICWCFRCPWWIFAPFFNEIIIIQSFDLFCFFRMPTNEFMGIAFHTR